MDEKGEGIEKYKLVIMEQSWDVKYGLGNRVDDIVITMCQMDMRFLMVIILWVVHLELV